MSEPRHLLIVHHSQSGSTRQMAEAVLQGASDDAISGVDVRSLDALTASANDLLWADGVILGSPENFGYMSGAMKYFLDRVYYACLDKVDGLPYALFVRAGNDGSGAISSINRIVSGLSMQAVQDPVLIIGDLDDDRLRERLADCHELGMTMAAGLEAGIF